jgi:hypothetical protein
MAYKKPNGVAVAAYLAAMIGLLAMGIVNVGTEASSAFNTWILQVGELWVPSAQGIGPYSGKETFLLLAWILSWAILHMMLRRRDVKLAVPVVVFVAGMALATLFVYTPFIDFLLGK